jgi:hypothetical protein
LEEFEFLEGLLAFVRQGEAGGSRLRRRGHSIVLFLWLETRKTGISAHRTISDSAYYENDKVARRTIPMFHVLRPAASVVMLVSNGLYGYGVLHCVQRWTRYCCCVEWCCAVCCDRAGAMCLAVAGAVSGGVKG